MKPTFLKKIELKPYIDIVVGSSIPPEAIKWIWPGYLAVGRLTVCAGSPGIGKTTLLAALIARITNGGVGGLTWPDGTFAPAGNVIVLATEDGIADTTVPRLIAAGANMDRVYILYGACENGSRRPFNFTTDMELLRQKIAEIGQVVLVAIDPLVQVVSGDANKNADVRRSFQPLMDAAEEHQFGVLGITHTKKASKKSDPLDRPIGSLAFSALPRVVLMATPVQQTAGTDKPIYLLARAKSNIGPDNGGFLYSINSVQFSSGHTLIETSTVAWEDAVSGSAKELLAWAEC